MIIDLLHFVHVSLPSDDIPEAHISQALPRAHVANLSSPGQGPQARAGALLSLSVNASVSCALPMFQLQGESHDTKELNHAFKGLTCLTGVQMQLATRLKPSRRASQMSWKVATLSYWVRHPAQLFLHFPCHAAPRPGLQCSMFHTKSFGKAVNPPNLHLEGPCPSGCLHLGKGAYHCMNLLIFSCLPLMPHNGF